MDVYVETPDGVVLARCPVCHSAAEIWRHSDDANSETETAVCCSNGEDVGPQIASAYSGCLLFMAPRDFVKATIREAVAFWNEYAAALELMRAQKEAAASPIIDDRLIVDTVNLLRSIAIAHHDSPQLRECIAHVIVPLLKQSTT
jgi:hypothetical protein